MGDDDLERQQAAELDAKRASLANARAQGDHEVLLATIEKGGEIGFSGGQPILACVTFRSLLHWRVFELERTGLFDRIMGQMSVAVENNTDNNAQLTYWLSNTFTLLHLLQRTLKTSSGSAGGRAKRSGGGSIFERFNSRLLASRTPTKKEGDSETPGIPGVRQVDAKYPAFLFKQQLTAFVEKIYGFLRDNMKKEITPQLGSCIQAPRQRGGDTGGRRGGGVNSLKSPARQEVSSASSSARTGAPFSTASTPCSRSCALTTCPCSWFESSSPRFSASSTSSSSTRSCSAASAAHSATASTSRPASPELENWLIEYKDWTGNAWEELRYIRQAVQLLVIHQKPKKTLNEITLELCPVLSIQQLYRISTMYWDDKYGTETVSQEVLVAMKELMMKDQNTNMSNSFLLDDDSSIHFTIDDISGTMSQIDLNAMQVPETLASNPAFEFLLRAVGSEA